jgi:hypothetical protein
MICINCGVELEDSMLICPLCGTPAVAGETGKAGLDPGTLQTPPVSDTSREITPRQKKMTWELISLVLLCGSVATFIVDFVLSRGMTWSELPVALCLAIFSYVSFFAFSMRSTFLKICLSCLLSALGFLLLDAYTRGIDWSIGKGIPMLLVSNMVVLAMILVVRKTVYKGINLIAFAFIAAACLCIAIESILSLNNIGRLSLHWSLLVTICLVPVIIVLLFVHIRMKKGRSLEKTFHI